VPQVGAPTSPRRRLSLNPQPEPKTLSPKPYLNITAAPAIRAAIFIAGTSPQWGGSCGAISARNPALLPVCSGELGGKTVFCAPIAPSEPPLLGLVPASNMFVRLRELAFMFVVEEQGVFMFQCLCLCLMSDWWENMPQVPAISMATAILEADSAIVGVFLRSVVQFGIETSVPGYASRLCVRMYVRVFVCAQSREHACWPEREIAQFGRFARQHYHPDTRIIRVLAACPPPKPVVVTTNSGRRFGKQRTISGGGGRGHIGGRGRRIGVGVYRV